MNISCYRGGAWDPSADILLTGDGLSTMTRGFGLSLPFPRILCPLRGLAPLHLFKKGEQAPDNSVTFGPSYHVLTEPALPPIDEKRLYQYVIARNGVFLLARNQDVDLCLPIPSRGTVSWLSDATPAIQFHHPLVGEELISLLLERAFAARDTIGDFNERLFCLTYREGTWHLHEPEQQASREHVEILLMTPEYANASIVGHSHHEMSVFFSRGDDKDEITQGWFKIFFVLGTITTSPEVLMRICAHGYAWEVDASLFFQLPTTIHDRWKGKYSG